MNKHGFTLLELMISIAVLAIVSGALYTASMVLTQAAQSQEAKTTTIDNAQSGMMLMVRNIRQASANSINWNDLPGPVLTYRAAQDVSGNGTAVDIGVNLELGPVRTLTRDVNDLNGDGITDSQLVLVEGGQARVITNGLLPDDGVLNRGLWFEQVGRGVRITLQTEQDVLHQSLPMRTTLVETVVPRN